MKNPVSFISHPFHIKSPSPFGEGLNFRPYQLYPTYRSTANIPCSSILTSAEQKIKKLPINILCPHFASKNMIYSLQISVNI